jgi:glycerol-1-phosphate dehydrogenase [NAD(P)+]
MQSTVEWQLSEKDISFEPIDSFLNRLDGKYALFTVDPPWSSYSKRLTPEHHFLIHETDKEILDELVLKVKGIQTIVGFGGGRAIDAAKYVSLQTGAAFVSVPSIIGADAYITPVAAIRTDGIVSYIGNKFASKVVIDSELIRSAPARLNRAGVGDIYSTKISLLDWKYARDHANAEYDPEVVRKAEGVLSKLHASKQEIRDVTDEGIQSLVQMHLQLNAIQWPYIAKGRTWPQEGIEHVFFYSLEKVTGRTFAHGEVLGTGCVVGAYFHQTDVEQVIEHLDSFGLKFRPQDYGMTFSEFANAIHNMKEITTAMGSRYEILDARELSDSEMKELWKYLV